MAFSTHSRRRLPETTVSRRGAIRLPFIWYDISAPDPSAVLLLLNRYVPLALAMLAPIIVNILLFTL